MIATEEFKTKCIGFDVRITYDDYDTHNVLVQSLDEINDICKTLENRDDSYHIEYKKKYILDDGTFLYTKKEDYTIDNPVIPQREIYLRKFIKSASLIEHSIDVRDEDIKNCYDILTKLMNIVEKRKNG